MTKTLTLHAYDGVDNVSAGDPHAVKIDLTVEDAVRYDDSKPPRLGRYDIGPWVEVTDQASGEKWEVASAPCGAGCHCAAVARRVA